MRTHARALIPEKIEQRQNSTALENQFGRREPIRFFFFFFNVALLHRRRAAGMPRRTFARFA